MSINPGYTYSSAAIIVAISFVTFAAISVRAYWSVKICT